MLFKKFTLLLISIFLSFNAYLCAQTNETYFGNIIDAYTEITDENIDLEELAGQLQELLNSPINLNTASKEELTKIFFLTDFQIHSILSYRNEYGSFISVNELRNLYGFDNNVFELVKPLITLEEKSASAVTRYKKSEILMRHKIVLEDKVGYMSDSLGSANYMGNRNYLLTKAKFGLGKYAQAGIVIEKDAGEKFLDNKNYPEFLSANVQWKKNNWNIILGDYHAQIGQGLMTWTGFGISKSHDVTNLSKTLEGIKPYRSSRENNFYRGLALQHTFKNFNAKLFYSFSQTDATIYYDSLTQQKYFSSEVSTGLHRTVSELNKKHAASYQIAGASFTYNFNRGKIQWTNLCHFINPYFIPSPEIENIGTFSGNFNYKSGLAYKYLFHKTLLFGETVFQQNGEYATINGAMLYVLPSLQLSVLQRIFSQGYWAPYANAFSESSTLNNEQGIYAGIKWNIYKTLHLSTYVDLFNFKWPTYQSSYPSRGNEYLILLNYALREVLDIDLFYKEQLKQKDFYNTENSVKLPSLTEELKQNARINIKTYISDNFKLQSRIEINRYKMEQTAEKGLIMFQDFTYKHSTIPISLTYRVLHYDTDGYNSRIYAYEPDVYQSFSIPFFCESGYKHVALLQINLLKQLTCWVKFAALINDSPGIGSGQEFIEENTRKEASMQLRYVF